jgi:nuclear pore complex protein Nup133
VSNTWWVSCTGLEESSANQSATQTKNANYSVKKLPSFPSALTRTPYTASAVSSAGLALAFTTDRALVWDYSNAGGPTKVVTLPLPFNLRPTDPLPIGAIVKNGPTNDYGVVAVAPSNGRIHFWENIDNAEARSLYPERQQGVEGSVKLYSGEIITDLVDIEHAGFILKFSSGRLAQLTLRDSQGRPSVSTAVLNGPNGSSSSLFSLRGLLGGAIRKTIASVKSRASDTKGQMEVITSTKNGVFQLWDLSWSGQQVFKHEVLAAVQVGLSGELRTQSDVQVLDFAITEQARTPGSVTVLVLVALFGRHTLDYSLLEVGLSTSGGVVTRTIPIKCFVQEHLPAEPTGTLLVPQPGHTAFALFPGAVVTASLAQPEESPDTQLLADSGRSNLPFQDAVYFREEVNVTVCGVATAATTRKERKSTALIFVQGSNRPHSSARSRATSSISLSKRVSHSPKKKLHRQRSTSAWGSLALLTITSTRSRRQWTSSSRYVLLRCEPWYPTCDLITLHYRSRRSGDCYGTLKSLLRHTTFGTGTNRSCRISKRIQTHTQRKCS